MLLFCNDTALNMSNCVCTTNLVPFPKRLLSTACYVQSWLQNIYTGTQYCAVKRLTRTICGGFVSSDSQDGFPIRIKAVNIINEPRIFKGIFAIIKPFLKEKMAERVTIVLELFLRLLFGTKRCLDSCAWLSSTAWAPNKYSFYLWGWNAKWCRTNTSACFSWEPQLVLLFICVRAADTSWLVITWNDICDTLTLKYWGILCRFIWQMKFEFSLQLIRLKMSERFVGFLSESRPTEVFQANVSSLAVPHANIFTSSALSRRAGW